MPDRLPKIEADALRECLRILSRHYPSELQSLTRHVERFIQDGNWPMFEALDVARLFYPQDDTKAAAFHGKLKAAIAAGELHPHGGDRLSPTSLCGWRSCDPVPADSPLRHWLPASMQGKVGKGSASVSRPGEREAYFRSLWLEFDKPARNEKIWKAMQNRKGSTGCPVVSVTGNVSFVFSYSDTATDLLDKSIFQKDMSAVRSG